MAETFAILVVRLGQAQLRHFRVELRGDTLWSASVEEVARRLRPSGTRRRPPELVAVAGEDAESARALAEALKRLDVAPVVLPLPMAPTAEAQLRGLVEAAVAQGLTSSLTGLRNTDALRTEVARRIARRERYAFLYADLDNFKAYNDTYSIPRGDEAIRTVAGMLQEAVKECGTPSDFLAHIGGDDFALVTSKATEPEFRRLADCIFAKRRQRLPELYDPEDRARGYIEAEDRQRQLRRYPLMTISIGAVSSLTRRITEYAQLMDYAGQCKQQAKLMEGDSCFVDRRRDDAAVPTR